MRAHVCVHVCVQVRDLSIYLSDTHLHALINANKEPCTYTHTHTLFLSLSLSLSHAHTYAHTRTHTHTHIAAATGWRQCRAQLAGHAMRRRHNPPHVPLLLAARLRKRFPRPLRSLGPNALLRATRGGRRVESSTGAACRTTCSPTAEPPHGAEG
jgi:hypothetical protein